MDSTSTVSIQRAPMISLLPAMPWVTPRLTRSFLQCPHHRSLARVATQPDLVNVASPKHTRAFKYNTRRASPAASASLVPGNGSLSRSFPLAKWTRNNITNRRYPFFPRTSEKPVAYWLLGSAASVFGIVVFGGLTRLTESGYAALFMLAGKVLIV